MKPSYTGNAPVIHAELPPSLFVLAADVEAIHVIATKYCTEDTGIYQDQEPGLFRHNISKKAIECHLASAKKNAHEGC